MPIDPAGTAPGLAKIENPEPLVNIKCKDTSCDSTQAVEVKIPGPEHMGQRLYRCAKCGFTWGINVGGHFTI